MISIIIVQWSVDITTNMSSYFSSDLGEFEYVVWWLRFVSAFLGSLVAPVVYEVGLNFWLCFFWYLSIQQKFIKPQPPRRKHYFQILSEKKLNCTMKVQLDGHWCIWEVMDHLKKMKINLKTIYWRRVFQS